MEDRAFREKWRYIRSWLSHVAEMGVCFVVTRSKNCNIVCYRMLPPKAAGAGPGWDAFWVNLEDCRRRGEPVQPIRKDMIEKLGVVEKRLAFGLETVGVDPMGRFAQVAMRSCPSKTFLVDVTTAECFATSELTGGEGPMRVARIHIIHDEAVTIGGIKVRGVLIYGGGKGECVRLSEEDVRSVSKEVL